MKLLPMLTSQVVLIPLLGRELATNIIFYSDKICRYYIYFLVATKNNLKRQQKINTKNHLVATT